MKILIKATHATDDVTLATVPFIQAKVALTKGHDVKIWLFGEAVHLVREAVRNSVQAPGLPSFKALFSEISPSIGKNVDIYICKPCAEARGLADAPYGIFAGGDLYLEHLLNWADKNDAW